MTWTWTFYWEGWLWGSLSFMFTFKNYVITTWSMTQFKSHGIIFVFCYFIWDFLRLFFFKCQCTRYQPLSAVDVGWRINRAQCLISSHALYYFFYFDLVAAARQHPTPRCIRAWRWQHIRTAHCLQHTFWKPKSLRTNHLRFQA